MTVRCLQVENNDECLASATCKYNVKCYQYTIVR